MWSPDGSGQLSIYACNHTRTREKFRIMITEKSNLSASRRAHYGRTNHPIMFQNTPYLRFKKALFWALLLIKKSPISPLNLVSKLPLLRSLHSRSEVNQSESSEYFFPGQFKPRSGETRYSDLVHRFTDVIFSLIIGPNSCLGAPNRRFFLHPISIISPHIANPPYRVGSEMF